MENAATIAERIDDLLRELQSLHPQTAKGKVLVARAVRLAYELDEVFVSAVRFEARIKRRGPQRSRRSAQPATVFPPRPVRSGAAGGRFSTGPGRTENLDSLHATIAHPRKAAQVVDCTLQVGVFAWFGVKRLRSVQGWFSQ